MVWPEAGLIVRLELEPTAPLILKITDLPRQPDVDVDGSDTVADVEALLKS